MNVEIPFDYCNLGSKDKLLIITYCEGILSEGGSVTFHGEEFKKIEDLEAFLDNYCNVVLPKLIEDLLEKSEKWLKDHPDFIRKKGGGGEAPRG